MKCPPRADVAFEFTTDAREELFALAEPVNRVLAEFRPKEKSTEDSVLLALCPYSNAKMRSWGLAHDCRWRPIDR